MNIQLMIHDTETPKHLRGLFPKRCGVGKITILGKTFETLFPDTLIAKRFFEDTFDVGQSQINWTKDLRLDCEISSVEVEVVS